MTTTTPESRARIAYTAYGRKLVPPFVRDGRQLPVFDELPEAEREGWLSAAQVLWDLRTTGRATM